MTGVFKFLSILFALLALASLGHDVWRAVQIENKFTLSQVGWLFQNYAPEVHEAFRQFMAATLGVKTFNAVIVPILSIYSLVFAGGLAALFAGLWLWLLRRHNPHRTARNFRHRPNHH